MQQLPPEKPLLINLFPALLSISKLKLPREFNNELLEVFAFIS
jgi:hypothetical protein